MAFWDKVKDFIGIEEDYYEEDEFQNDVNDSDYGEKVEKKSESTLYASDKKEENNNTFEKKFDLNRSYRTETRQTNNKNLGVNKSMLVSIKEPLTFDDVKNVLDDVISGKTVVLNLEMLEIDIKTQIFYFVSGGLYSLRGSLHNVTKDIYVLVPEGVSVDSKLKETIAEKSLYQI
ncbi:cell division protein SepF [Helcococcus ovis]|uniref:cell division protein SepF n=1 Tax=Helcococcus ovis TaxID=72026 RepID=UPI0038BC6BD7